MKTQIIHLSQKEDIVSVKEKMSWCQAGRILLIWPGQSKVLTQELELTLVKRYAGASGCELAFVCMDPQVRNISSQLGIAVFENIRQAQEQEWKTDRSKKFERRPDFLRPETDRLGTYGFSKPNSMRWSSSPLIRVICLGISVLAIITLAGFILPGAKVTFSPRHTTQSVQLDVYADQNATAINYFTSSIPVYNKEIIVQGSEVISTTGSLLVPQKSAHVSLSVINKSLESVTIAPGSEVSTLGVNRVRFLTENVKDISIEPGDSVTLQAQAVYPGLGGNIPANSSLAFEGIIGTLLEVNNPKAGIGGVDAQIKIPSEADLQILQNRLDESLKIEALNKLQSSLPQQDILVSSSAKIEEILEEAIQPAIGAPGEEVSLFRHVRVRVSVIAGATLHSFVTPILEASIPNGYTAVDSSLGINLVSIQEADTGGRIPLKINATRTIEEEIPTNQLAKSIRGETVAEAAEKISAFTSLDSPPEIFLLPRGWPRLPFLAMRISFVQAPAQ